MNTALQLLLGIGIIQSFILGIVLFKSKGEKKIEAQHYSLLLFLLALLIFSEILELYQLERHFSFLMGISILLDLVIAPLIWNLAVFLTSKTKKPKPWSWKIYIPVMIGMVWYFTGYKWMGTTYNFSGLVPDSIAIMVMYKGLVILFYLYFTIKRLMPYLSKKKSEPQLFLIYLILWPFTLIAVVSYFTFWLQFWGVHLPIDSDYLGCVMGTLYVYYLTFMIIRKPQLLGINQASFKLKKYNNSSISEDIQNQHLQSLLTYLKREKPFVNEKLSLHDLADQLNISTNLLSQVINEGTGKTYYDLINEFRMQEVKNKLINPYEDHKTILALAFESGFQSKASFNRIFKKSEGITPSQYRKKYMSHPS